MISIFQRTDCDQSKMFSFRILDKQNKRNRINKGQIIKELEYLLKNFIINEFK